MKDAVLKYDGSFKGFLTCIFDAFEQKLRIVEIIPAGEDQSQLFCEMHQIISDELKALRVLKGLKGKVSSNGMTRIKWAFLSEAPGIEMKLYEMICYIFSKKVKVDQIIPIQR